MRSFAIAVPIAAALLLAQTAGAQTGRYDVKTMNFDLWCQETAKDEKRFEAYRAKIEKYEIPYLQRKENEILLDRNVLHNDPVGNPLDKNYEAQTQSTPQTNSNPQ
jgi:hypothetical protein